jgi:ElaB/YqjD/DUF883 family membrane-anchored ribosome-binding protein
MSIERMTETSRTVTAAAQDVVGRAGTYARRHAERLGDRGRELRREANERLARSTGRPLETWVAQAHGYVKTRRLQLLAVTIILGYVLGKLLRR